MGEDGGRRVLVVYRVYNNYGIECLLRVVVILEVGDLVLS